MAIYNPLVIVILEKLFSKHTIIAIIELKQPK